MSDATLILQRAQNGDPGAAEELLPLVYDELRKLASHRLGNDLSSHTLQPTALVHEAWLKLTGTPHDWNGREHFFRAAAQAMRQILIDRARAKQSQKRGAGQVRVDWSEVDLAVNSEPETLLILDEALQKLASEHPDKADLVKLRFYTGLTVEETARVLGVSEKTVKRQWTHARALLFQEITRASR